MNEKTINVTITRGPFHVKPEAPEDLYDWENEGGALDAGPVADLFTSCSWMATPRGIMFFDPPRLTLAPCACRSLACSYCEARAE